jgi:peptide/nickel transport system permease protein
MSGAAIMAREGEGAPTLRPRRRRGLPVGLVAGAAVLGLILADASLQFFVAALDPVAFDYDALLAPPSAAHWFGTDNFGRDMFARTLAAGAVDLQIALFCTLVPIVFGSAVGALAGYHGGTGDAILGRIIDVVITFPFLVLVIAIVAVLGPGLVNMYIAVSCVGWVFYARIVRAEIAVLRRSDFAAAGRVMGFSTARIVFRHLLPNAAIPVLVYWMTDMALCILLGSSLGYLGLGAQPPTAEWGVLVSDGKNYMDTAWWISVFPGLAIVVCGTALSLLGDGIASLLTVKQ